MEEIGLANRFVDLAPDLHVHRHAWIVSDAARVDEPERAPGPIGLGEMAIPRRSGFFRNDGAVVADDSVEQR